MPPLRRIIVLVQLLLVAGSLYGQNGGLLLSNYSENKEIENQSWAICQDENNVMMFANIRGILTFDGQGQNFNLINIPVIPYSLRFNSQARKVFVGGDNNYGYLKRDEKGLYQFVSLKSDSVVTGIISRIVFTDSTVWFCGEKSLSEHYLSNGKLRLHISQKEGLAFNGMFVTPKNIFINVLSRGLYRLEADTLFPIVTGYLLENTEVLFGLPYDKDYVLLGLGDGSLSLFDGIKFYPYQVKDNGYLKNNILSEGIVLSDSLYAFATLDGGALVIERKSGVVRHTVNYLNGLPDDEIFAIGADNTSGLWLSHQYGLTRAELMLPISNMGVYPGLKGNLINNLWYNNELYVATSEGVYYLTEIKNYSSTEVYVKQDQPGIRVPVQQPSGTLQLQPAQEDRKTKKSIFTRIFGKRYTQEQQKDETAAPVSQEAQSQGSSKTSYIRRTVSSLKSIEYLYKKVEGLNEKCRQLLPSSDGILASTSKGLYVVSDHKARLIAGDRNIFFVSRSEADGRFYVAAADGYFIVANGPGGWVATYPDKSFTTPLYSITSAGANTIWAGSDELAVKISMSPKPVYRYYNVKTDYPQRCRVKYVNDTLFVFTESGIDYYKADDDTLLKYQKANFRQGSRPEFLISQTGAIWMKQDGEWSTIGNRFSISTYDMSVLKIFDNIVSIFTDEKNLWVISGDNQLYRISRGKLAAIKPSLDLFVKSVQNEKGLYFSLSDIVFDSGDNNIYFDIVAPGYQKRNSVQYQYIVDGMMDSWSKWSTRSTINLLLPHGTYTLRVKARDIWGNMSEPIQKTFTIKTPFMETSFFMIMVIILACVLVVVVIRFRERHLQHEKHILEEKVKERTAEIEAQKQEITSSIEYAGRIQQAMLPMDEIFNNAFAEHFIMFRPRDIVSGDFFWIGEDANHYFFTVADCTGHGVPGAFMSTLGISTLNEIITNKSDLHANTVLNLLRSKIKTSLHQTGKEGEAADGMDIAFCILHKNRKTLEYAGAYNPMMIFQGGELKEYKADRMPIGIYVGEKESFTNYELNVGKGDIIYLFSDGIIDQFGGPDGSKFKRSSLKKLLTSINDKPLSVQKDIIEKEFDQWRGGGAQIDDVTIIGVRI